MKIYFSRDFQYVGPPKFFYLPAPSPVKGLSQELFPEELSLTGNISGIIIFVVSGVFIYVYLFNIFLHKKLVILFELSLARKAEPSCGNQYLHNNMFREVTRWKMRSRAKKYYNKGRFGNRDRNKQFRYKIIAPKSIEKLHSSPSYVYDHIIMS